MTEETKEQKTESNDKPKLDKVTKTMTIGEVMQAFPEAGGVMMKHGLHCIGCHVAFHETIEQGCKAHGMPDDQIDKLIDEINEGLKKKKVTTSES